MTRLLLAQTEVKEISADGVVLKLPLNFIRNEDTDVDVFLNGQLVHHDHVKITYLPNHLAHVFVLTQPVGLSCHLELVKQELPVDLPKELKGVIHELSRQIAQANRLLKKVRNKDYYERFSRPL